MYTRTLGLSGNGIFARVTKVNVSDYVQSGDADDTASINRAITAAAALYVSGGSPVEVVADNRKRYTITPGSTTVAFTTPSGGQNTYAACIKVPTGVIFNGNGATFKLGNTTPCYLIANANPNTLVGTRDHDLGWKDMVVDGNNVDPGVTSTSVMLLAYVDRPKILGTVRIQNGQFQATMFMNLVGGVFENMEVDSFVGNGLGFGTPVGTNNGVYDSRIGTLRASNVSSYGGNQPGNGVGGVFIRSTIGTIEHRTCSAGIKILGQTQDLNIGQVVVDSCGLPAVLNSGLKIQGDDVNGWYPTRVEVGQVASSNNTGQGLYLELCIDCKVNSYVGYNNGIGTTPAPDVWLAGTRNTIGSVTSDKSAASAVEVRANAVSYRVDRIVAHNPAVGVTLDGGSGSIGELLALDDRGTPAMARGLSDFSGTAVCTITRFSSTGHTIEASHVTSSGVVLPGGLPDIQTIFTPSGTWTKPAGAKMVTALVMGGGCGGGSGRRTASGTVGCGGGGGGGGGFSHLSIPASLLTATVAVLVGSGGSGGAAVTTDSTNGNNGSAGNFSQFGPYLRAQTGAGGSGGTTSTGTGGGGGNGLSAGSSGAAASVTGGAGVGGTTGNGGGPGGGSGGGLATTPAATAGGNGGIATLNNATAGGTGSVGAAGGNGTSVTAGMPEAGSGGAGGSSATTTDAFAGGNGGSYGAGGGGGGASLNTFNSGKGGDGAPGICVVYSW